MCANDKCSKYINLRLYLTIGEMVFWILFLGIIVQVLVALLPIPNYLIIPFENDNQNLGETANILYALSICLSQRTTLWNLFFGLSFGI